MLTTTKTNDRKIKKHYGSKPEFVVQSADMYISRYHYSIRYVPKHRNGKPKEFPFVLTKHQTRTVRGKKKDIGWFFSHGHRTFEAAQAAAKDDLIKRMEELERFTDWT